MYLTHLFDQGTFFAAVLVEHHKRFAMFNGLPFCHVKLNVNQWCSVKTLLLVSLNLRYFIFVHAITFDVNLLNWQLVKKLEQFGHSSA